MDEEHSDFQQLSEESEKLDFNKLIPCPHCKKPIPHDAAMCLYCGEEARDNKKPTWVVWVAILLIVVFAVFILLSM